MGHPSLSIYNRYSDAEETSKNVKNITFKNIQEHSRTFKNIQERLTAILTPLQSDIAEYKVKVERLCEPLPRQPYIPLVYTSMASLNLSITSLDTPPKSVQTIEIDHNHNSNLKRSFLTSSFFFFFMTFIGISTLPVDLIQRKS